MLKVVMCVWLVSRCISALDKDHRKLKGESKLIHIDQGPVLGYRDPDTGVYIFNSIPYATAPKGANRFKAPLPPPTWIDPFEAVEKGIICPQGLSPLPNFLNKTRQEDCLNVNVYVPATNEKDLPVVVYVHGGAFQLGFGNLGTPKHLVKSKKIIALTFNYRVGVHGFLCLGTKDVPGNAGMKDQVALLRWVKKNIVSFGGNPDEVTIAGFSAGAAAVDLLMLSTSAKGLFKRVIPESGSSTVSWAVQLDPFENAKKYAQMLNFSDADNIYALESFYKTASFELLTLHLFMHETDSTFAFSPCVERELNGVESFLIDAPVNILKNGNYVKLPTLYGFANMEGIFRSDVFELWKDKMNEKFSDFLPADLQFENEEQKEQMAKNVKMFYFGGKSVNNDTVILFIDYFTDVLFAFGSIRSLKMQVAAGNNDVFLYEYSFIDDSSTPIPSLPNIRGAKHCAQTDAILDGEIFNAVDEDILSIEYKNMKTVMRELWLNFMTTGKPVPAGSKLPEWPSAGVRASPHMSLGRILKLRGSLLPRRMQFWADIYNRHYRIPIPPPVHRPF